MRKFAIVFTLFFTAPLIAQEADNPIFPMSGSEDLNEFLWINRPLVVFADTPEDPRFILQMDWLQSRPAALIDRDVIVLIDTDPAAKSPLRETLRPNGFSIVLLGKDGQVKLRKPRPWQVRDINRVIDKMPMRIDELKDRAWQDDPNATR